MFIHIQMFIGLFIGLFILIYMVLRTKVHVFLALIIASALTGLIGGMDSYEITNSITRGFGSTLSTIGIIVGFGVMMGEIFEISGAAEKMALVFLKLFGKKREALALSVTGAIVSIPIFCDSGFVLLSSLARAISKKTGKTIFVLGPSLAVGLLITHHLIPPTPGPLTAAFNYNVNYGVMVLWGIIFSIPMLTASLIYIKLALSNINQIPYGTNGWRRVEDKTELKNIENHIEIKSKIHIPDATTAFFPILLPVILILLNTGFNFLQNNLNVNEKLPDSFISVITFIGNPIIAVGLGLLAATITLTRDFTKNETTKAMENGIRNAGIILLVTGASGSFGRVLNDSGIATYITNIILKSGIPPIIMPFIIATIIRFIQGSGTVAMVTSSAICAPIILPLNASPLFSAMASCTGAMFFSYFNDSYFWVVTRMLGIDNTREQIKAWSITTTVAWAVGFIMLLVCNGLFGNRF